MANLTRRKFLEIAASFGAALAWRSSASGSGVSWHERRDLYPQGVASGDPFPDSVILWTRRPPSPASSAKKLTAEISEDHAFRRVVAKTDVELTPPRMIGPVAFWQPA
jgi:alkaline phosphatase D